MSELLDHSHVLCIVISTEDWYVSIYNTWNRTNELSKVNSFLNVYT